MNYEEYDKLHEQALQVMNDDLSTDHTTEDTRLNEYINTPRLLGDAVLYGMYEAIQETNQTLAEQFYNLICMQLPREQVEAIGEHAERILANIYLTPYGLLIEE